MKIKKTHFYFGIFVIAALIAAALFYFNPFSQSGKEVGDTQAANQALAANDDGWNVDANGYLSYPSERGNVNFRRENYSETDALHISRIVYQSSRGNVYGLLAIPKIVSGELPGVVLLPGAGVSKESELYLAEKISGMGIAVLTIDQRGVGQSDSKPNSIDQDYHDFANEVEPYQHLMVYDALRAYDLLSGALFIDKSRIIIAGESLGGRIAVISTAIEPGIRGVLVISSSGFPFSGGNDTLKNRFVNSINSDHYIADITPRKIVMIHGINDTVIPIDSAVSSFMKAQEPKKFVVINDTSCHHGYCESMKDALAASMEYLLDVKSKNP